MRPLHRLAAAAQALVEAMQRPDIARMLALGADFVLMGRPFVYAVAAIGQKGADHVMHILKEELKGAMAQMGCPTVGQLPGFLIES